METIRKNRDFGARLQAVIESRGLKNTDFASAAGLKPNTLSNYVQGVSTPSYEVLASMVKILDVSTDFLLGLTHIATKQPKSLEDAQVNAQVNAQAKHESKINHVSKAVQLQSQSSSQPARTEIIVATQDTTGNPTYTVVNHKAAANYLNGYQSQEYYEHLGVVTLPRTLTGSSKQGIFLQIEGDSMTPKFQHGDWVACTLLDRSEWSQVRDLDCYVIVSSTYGIQFKRVKSRLREQGFLRCKSDNRRHRPYNIEEENLLQLFRFVLHVSPDASNPEDALYQKVDHLEDTTTDLREMLEQMQERLEELAATKKPAIGHEKAH